MLTLLGRFGIPAAELLFDGWASTSWTAVEARVIEDGRLLADGTQPLSYVFTDQDGVEHRNSRFSFAYDERSARIDAFVRERARPVLQADGTTAAVVTAFYDPANPAHSCLRPGVATDLWFPLALGSSILLGSVRVLRFAATRLPPKRVVAPPRR